MQFVVFVVQAVQFVFDKFNIRMINIVGANTLG